MIKKLVVMLLVACFLIMAGCYEIENSSQNSSSENSAASSLLSSEDESIPSSSVETPVVSQNSSKEETRSIYTAPSTPSSQIQSSKAPLSSVTSSASSIISTPQSTTQSTVTQTHPATGKTVYVTPTGKRYHIDPDCGGKNSTPSTLDAAMGRGLTPCQKCAQ